MIKIDEIFCLPGFGVVDLTKKYSISPVSRICTQGQDILFRDQLFRNKWENSDIFVNLQILSSHLMQFVV